MENKKTYIWLDCDPGLDDVLAIILAASNPFFELYGVSTSAGNTNLQNTTRNALNVLHNCDRDDVPVFVGSQHIVLGQMKMAEHMHGSDGLGGVKIPQSKVQPIRENVFNKIYTRVMECPDQIIWANTGALTNLYFLLSSHPQIKKKIKEIVIMGGSIGGGNRTPAAQFNIFFDPFAAKGVFQKKGQIPMTLIPLDVTHTVVANQQVFKKLKGYKNPFAQAIHTMLKQYQQMYLKAYGKTFPYPPVHDPCVMFYIQHRDKFQVKKALVQIDTYPTSYGRTNIWFSKPEYPDQQLKTIDKVATKCLDIDKFWQVNFEAFDRVFEKTIE